MLSNFCKEEIDRDLERLSTGLDTDTLTFDEVVFLEGRLLSSVEGRKRLKAFYQREAWRLEAIGYPVWDEPAPPETLEPLSPSLAAKLADITLHPSDNRNSDTLSSARADTPSHLGTRSPARWFRDALERAWARVTAWWSSGAETHGAIALTCALALYVLTVSIPMTFPGTGRQPGDQLSPTSTLPPPPDHSVLTREGAGVPKGHPGHVSEQPALRLYLLSIDEVTHAAVRLQPEEAPSGALLIPIRAAQRFQLVLESEADLSATSFYRYILTVDAGGRMEMLAPRTEARPLAPVGPGSRMFPLERWVKVEAGRTALPATPASGAGKLVRLHVLLSPTVLNEAELAARVAQRPSRDLVRTHLLYSPLRPGANPEPRVLEGTVLLNLASAG